MQEFLRALPHGFAVTGFATSVISLAVPLTPLAAEPLNETPTEVVVVSASRHSQSEYSIKQSISLIDRSNIRLIEPEHPSEVMNTTPGTWVARGSGQEHLTAIRSPVFTGAGSCGNFLVTEDLIPVRATGFCNTNQLFDTQYETASSVEILRGPHSSVYGSNALFGGIHVMTPSGSGDNYLKAQTASTHNSGLHWVLFNDTAGSFGSLVHDKGWRHNSGVNQRKFGVATKHSFFNADIRNVIQVNSLEQETAGFIEGKDAFKNEASREDNATPEAYRTASSLRAHSQWRWQEQSSELEVTPYIRHHEMEFLMHFVPWQSKEENAHSSLGVRSQWRNTLSDTKYVSAGAEFEFTRAKLLEFQNSEAPFGRDRFPTGVHYDYSTNARQAALFGQFNVKPTPNTEAELKGRGDWINYDYTNLTQDGWACETGVENCRFYRPASNNKSFFSPSFSATFSVDLSPTTLLYTGAHKAFRHPQAVELFRLQSNQQGDLNSVNLQSIEAGLKSDLKSATLRVAVFDMHQTNGIFMDGQRRFVSGSDSRHSGIEYNLLLRLNSALFFRVGGSFSRHIYQNDVEIDGTTQSITGNFYDTAPRQSYYAVFDWNLSSAIASQLRWSYQGKYFLEPLNQHTYNGHQLVDLAVRSKLTSNTSLQLNIKNVFNQHYAERADYAFGNYRYFPGLSRRIQASLTYVFN